LHQLAIDHPENPLLHLLDSLPPSQIPGALILLTPEDLASIFTGGFAILHVQLNNIEHRLTDVRQGSFGFTDSGYAVNDTGPTRSNDGKEMMNMDGKETMSAAAPIAPPDRRWGFFITGGGELADVETTSEARGSSFTTGGVTVGADYRVTDHFVLGAAIGYANTSADLSFDGSIHAATGKANLYGTYYDGGFYVNGIVGGGYGSLDTRRLTIGGFARGETNTADFDALIGTGYDHHVGKWTFGPLASLRFGLVDLDGFAEHGALGALWIDSQSENSLRSALGLQASYSATLGRVPVTPFIRAQWEHEFLDSTSSIDAGFTPSDIFTVHGPHIGRDALLLDVGASAQITARVGIYSYYTGEIGRENYNAHTISGGVRVSF
jgi:outer membrane autotransporter protein